MTDNATPKPADTPAPAPTASENLDTQISKLAKQIETGTLHLREATERAVAQSTPQPQQPAYQQPLTEAELTKIADEKGVGAAIAEHMKRTEAPAFIGLLEQNADMRKELLRKDPVFGKVISKYGKEIDAKIKELGLNPAQLAGKAYTDVVRLVAAENDPAMLLPEQPAPAAPAPKPAPAPAAPAPAPVTAVEVPFSGTVTAPPTPSRTTDEEVKAEPITEREANFVRDVFDMTPTDLKKQRYEMRKNTEKYGEDGLKRIGGMPILSFSDMGLPEPR